MGWLESQQGYFNQTPSTPQSSGSSGGGWLESQQSYFSKPQAQPSSTNPSSFPSGPIVQPNQINQTPSWSDNVDNFFSGVGKTINNAVSSVENNSTISQIGKFISPIRTEIGSVLSDQTNKALGSATGKAVDSPFLQILSKINDTLGNLPGNQYYKEHPDETPLLPAGEKLSGNSAKDIANIILNNLNAFIPTNPSGELIEGFSKSKAVVSAVMQAGLQITAGAKPSEVLQNLPFGLLGGADIKDDPIELTPEQARNEVVTTDLKDTSLGKELLKTSFSASENKSNIQLSFDPTSELKTATGFPVKIDLIDSVNNAKSAQEIAQQGEIKTFSGGDTEWSTTNKEFAKTFADNPVERTIKQSDVLDTRIPEQRAQLESVLGKAKVDQMIERTDNGLPNHAQTGEQDALISAARELGYKNIALSETDTQTKFEGQDVISYAETGLKESNPIRGQLTEIKAIQTPDDAVLNPIIDQINGKIRTNEEPTNSNSEPSKSTAPKNLEDLNKSTVKSESKQDSGTAGRKNSGESITRPKSTEVAKPESSSSNPSGNGEKLTTTAKSKLSSDIEKALNTEFKDLPGYEKMNMKDQAEKAVDLLSKDPEQAKKIAMGETSAPGDLKEGSVFRAVEAKALAEGDIQTLHDLAKTKLAGEAGQALKAYDTGNSSNELVKALHDVIQAKTKEIESKTGKTVNRAIKDEINNMTKEVDKLSSNRGTLAKLIKEIQCK